MKKTFALLTILLLGNFAVAQDINPERKKALRKSVDSLTKLLSAPDLSKTKIIDHKLALSEFHFQLYNDNQSLSILNEVEALSLEIQDTFGIASSAFSKAGFYDYKGEYEKSITYGKKAVSLFKAIHNNPKDRSYQIHESYNALADCYMNMNLYNKAMEAVLATQNYLPSNNEKLRKQLKINMLNSLAFINSEIENNADALQNLKEALLLSNEINDEQLKGNTYNVFAIIYSKQNENTKALEYYKLALDIYKKHKDKRGEAVILSNSAASHFKLENYDKAEELLHQAIKIGAKQEFKAVVAESYLYLGKVYLKQNKTDLGLVNINKSIEISKEINSSSLIIENLLEQAKVAQKTNNKEGALTYLNQSLSLAKTAEAPELKKKTYRELSRTYEDIDYKTSLSYYRKYCMLNDSIFNMQKTNHSEALKAEFNFLKIQSDLKNKETELALMKTKESASNNKIIFTAVLIIVLIVFLVIILLRQKKLIKTRKKMWFTQKELMTLKQENLDKEIGFKNQQITDFAIHISEKNDLLEQIKKEIKKINISDPKVSSQINNILLFINDDISQNKEKVQLYSEIDETTDSFNHKLTSLYPNLTAKERKVATLVRLNHTSKQIALQLNITPASVDNHRSNIRKKMNVPKETSLSKFIKTM